MRCRLAEKADRESILEIIKESQAYFKEAGIDQWQNGYPNMETIEADIEAKKSYVLENEGNIVATAALSFNDESTYDVIYEGEWVSNESYAVIHRVAVSREYKGNGIAGALFETLVPICKETGAVSIKIDTHEDNHSMQRFLEKLGFQYCGIIFLKDRNKRIAFEKIIVTRENE